MMQNYFFDPFRQSDSTLKLNVYCPVIHSTVQLRVGDDNLVHSCVNELQNIIVKDTGKKQLCSNVETCLVGRQKLLGANNQ